MFHHHLAVVPVAALESCTKRRDAVSRRASVDVMRPRLLDPPAKALIIAHCVTYIRPDMQSRGRRYYLFTYVW